MRDTTRIQSLLDLAAIIARRNGWERTMQSVGEARSGLVDDLSDAAWDEANARRLSPGMGSNDPANAAAAFVEGTTASTGLSFTKE